MENEYQQEPCVYCGRKRLRNVHAGDLTQTRHISEPITFDYVHCDACGRIQCKNKEEKHNGNRIHETMA